jgi:hypothetical protein
MHLFNVKSACVSVLSLRDATATWLSPLAKKCLSAAQAALTITAAFDDHVLT